MDMDIYILPPYFMIACSDHLTRLALCELGPSEVSLGLAGSSLFSSPEWIIDCSSWELSNANTLFDADVSSLGCIWASLLTGELPWTIVGDDTTPTPRIDPFTSLDIFNHYDSNGYPSLCYPVSALAFLQD